MTSKELFNLNKPLRDSLIAVTSSTWFAEAMVYVQAALLDGNMTAEQLVGAKKFQTVLLTISDPAYTPPPPLKSGLVHQIDNPNLERTTIK